MLGVTALAKGCGEGHTSIAPPPLEPARPTAVTVSPAMAELTVLGETAQLAKEVRDQNAGVMAGITVTRRSSEPSVGTTDTSGVAIGVGEADATMTASARSAPGSAVVTVMQPAATVEVTHHLTPASMCRAMAPGPRTAFRPPPPPPGAPRRRW